MSRAAAIAIAASLPASLEGATTVRAAAAMLRSWAITSRYATEAPARLALRSRWLTMGCSLRVVEPTSSAASSRSSSSTPMPIDGYVGAASWSEKSRWRTR